MLAQHEGLDRLRRFIPLMDPDEAERREMWMPPALHQWLNQGDRRATLSFKPNIRAFLKRFVVGQEIDNQDYMKSWKLDVFELRVQIQPRREATRIFGAFIKPDVFMAVHQRLRSSFGGATDPAWDEAIDRVVDLHERLFPGCRRVPSRPFSSCVTFNGYDHDRA